jgi:hypothetical protein
MNNKNAEGYPDPTAHDALATIAREAKAYRPLVYIASAYAGNTEHNVERAQRYCRFAISKGCIPLAPHLHYPQFMDDGDPDEREMGLFFALVLLGKCHELWVFGERISDGMSREIAKAENRGMPIRYFNSKCEEAAANGK